MENVYSTFLVGKDKRSLTRSSSLPLFNTNQRKCKPIVSPDILKMQMMEERLNQLEQQKRQQNEQLESLMSYQMNQNQNRLNNNYNNYTSNGLMLSPNNVLPPIGYQLNTSQPIEKKYYIMKTSKHSHRKEKKLKEYRKNIEELKELLEEERNKRKRNRYMKENMYLPLRQDINSFMNDMNYKIQKKLQNDNNRINANINEVQNSYDEIKYLLK